MMENFWDKILQFCQTTTQTIGDRLIDDFGERAWAESNSEGAVSRTKFEGGVDERLGTTGRSSCRRRFGSQPLPQATTPRLYAPSPHDPRHLQAIHKEDGSLVTKADRWADGELTTAITNAFPDHGVLTEETTQIFPGNEWCWIVDPIDGTTNFTRGVPIWAISLGLLYRGTPVFGFVYLPQLKQSFHGYWYGDSGLEGPEGAYLNQKRIYTSQDSPSKSHLFNLCARSTEVLKNPFPCKIRMIGVASYNLLLVAAGAALGGVEATPKIWDLAAVWVIVQAAGGKFVFLASKPVFPLQIGQNYGNISLPCLAVSREELIADFLPLVKFLGDRAESIFERRN